MSLEIQLEFSSRKKKPKLTFDRIVTLNDDDKRKKKQFSLQQVQKKRI